MAQTRLTKLVLPVAGLGTRLLPLTLTTPKALVLVAGRPLLDYMLDEAVDSGMKEVIIVISPFQEEAFDAYMASRKSLFPTLKMHIRVQQDPLGDGHAVLQAADILKSTPFAVRFSDDVVIGKKSALRSLIDAYKKRKGPVILLERVPWESVSRYGVVGSKELTQRGHRITSMVEKPARKDAPSNLTIVGGYVLAPTVMRDLKRMAKKLATKEKDALRLSSVFREELERGDKIYGWELSGKRLDCGTLEGLAEAEAYIRKSRKK